MKTIIMVQDMNCENCAKKIENALLDTRVDFEIILASKSVVVNGNVDMAAIARQKITDIGFTVI